MLLVTEHHPALGIVLAVLGLLFSSRVYKLVLSLEENVPNLTVGTEQVADVQGSEAQRDAASPVSRCKLLLRVPLALPLPVFWFSFSSGPPSEVA